MPTLRSYQPGQEEPPLGALSPRRRTPGRPGRQRRRHREKIHPMNCAILRHRPPHQRRGHPFRAGTLGHANISTTQATPPHNKELREIHEAFHAKRRAG